MAATFGADSNFVERFHDLHQKLTKRRLLRKPNYKEAAQQYRELFEEIKAHEKTNQGGGRTGMRLRYYSALCQIGIAKCEQVPHRLFPLRLHLRPLPSSSSFLFPPLSLSLLLLHFSGSWRSTR